MKDPATRGSPDPGPGASVGGARSSLRLLLVEDSVDDALLLDEELRHVGYDPRVTRVQSEREMRSALEREPWDLVVSDHSLPGFSSLGALRLLRERDEDTPFLIVSGTIGEDQAVAAVKAGASDYILKGNLSRLGPAVDRELREARLRRERRRTEETLRRTEEKYRRLFEESKDTVFISDSQGRFLDVNPAGVELFGFSSREEICGAPASSLYAAPGDLPSLLAAIAERGYVKDFEVGMRRTDGGALTVLVTATAVTRDDGGLAEVRGIIRDVTAQRRLEAQFLHSQKMEAVGRLASGVAHDFNNLLTVILGFAAVAKQALGADHAVHEYVQWIEDSARRAAGLTSQLLAFARKQVVTPRIVCANDVIAELEKMLRHLLGEDIELATRLAPDLGVMRIDPGQLEQILANLVVNARDAMPGGGRLTIATTNVESGTEEGRAAVPPGRWVMISVADTGCGMTEELMNHVFEPFFTTKGPGKGTGLGLATCYGIVTQAGGQIRVASTPGEGATFRIYLPRVVGVSPETKKAGATAMPGGTEAILVVEDEPRVRSFAATVLRALGYTVVEAGGGEAALAVLAERGQGVDLLLTDVVMPKMSGREVVDRVTLVHPQTRVLYMSGHADDSVVRHGAARDRMPFLQKPFGPDQLARKVREVLDGGRWAEGRGTGT